MRALPVNRCAVPHRAFPVRSASATDLHAVGQFDQFIRFPSRVVGSKRDVIGRMPVLCQHHVLEQRRDAVDDWHDRFPVSNRQATTGHEAILDIDNEQGCLS